MTPRALRPAPLLLVLLLSLPARAGDEPAPAAPAAPASAGAPSTGLPWKPATHGKGRLEVLPSGLAVLHVEGTPEEMGAQHGTLLRDAVRALVRDYLPGILRGSRELALAKARELEKQIPERHRREMRALAEAAGISCDDALLGSVVVELFGLNACSGAVASGSRTADGRTVVGRNLEWPDRGVLGKYGLVIAARPEGRRPFLSIGFPAVVGVVTGMNADGVFAGELVVMNAPRGDRSGALKGIPYPILQRLLMEDCGSLAEAEELVRKSPRTVPQNLLLADPAGGAVLECGASRCVERPSVDGLVVVTNYWDERERPPEMDPRYRDLCDAFVPLAGGKVDAAAMEKTMREVSSGSLAAALNLQCGVFEPASLRVRISVGRPPACSRPLIPLDGAALLGVTAPEDRRVAGATK